MITYVTATRQAPFANGLDVTQQFANGQSVAGPKTTLAFAGRKPITRVPMSYCLNGPANEILGEGIYTNDIAGCEAIVVLGYDVAMQLQHVGFSHVRGGDPAQLDWAHLFNNMNQYPTVYVCIASSRPTETIGEDLLYQHITNGNNNIPAVTDVLIYGYGSDHAEIGKTFGINRAGQVGEVDSTRFAERNTSKKLNRTLINYMAQNAAYPYTDETWAMKTIETT
jgi:hypothetical protein